MIFNIILPLAGTITILLGFVVLFHSRERTSVVFFLLCLSLFLWASTILVFWNVSEDLRFWSNLNFFGPTVLAGALLYFSFLFPQNTRPSLATEIIILLATLVVLGFVLFQQISIEVPNQWTLKRGIGYSIFNLFLLFSVFFSCVKLIFKTKRVHDIELMQLKYVVFAIIVAALFGLLFNLFLPWAGITQLSRFGPLLAGSIFASITSFAVIKHHLFNVRVVATELITFTLWVFLLIRALLSTTLVELAINGSLLLLTIILGILLIRSVLREVQAREQIEKLAKELEFANKELKRLDAAKSEFISIASHQLRTPLSIIKGYISMIREGSYGTVSENVQKTMNKIYFSNERLIKLVTDLLDLSRMESGKLQYEFAEFNMVELADSIVEEFRTPANDRGIAIVWKKTQEALTVWGDSWKLRQVIFNLIDNSLKYTEKGSIAISLQTNNNMVILSVRDTGIGMTPETAHGLFQKFARGKDSSKINSQGLGLGLFIAKKIIDDHQGKLWAESSGEGKGSAFYLELPTAAAVKQKKDFTELMENL